MDIETARSLLFPPNTSPILRLEEKEHPWLRPNRSGIKPNLWLLQSFLDATYKQLWDKPLFRVYDDFSGSIPDENFQMVARASRRRLDTAASRRETLATHLQHNIWEPTPYIWFTSSPAALAKLADFRQFVRERGDQHVIVIDPRRRFALGLPLLDYGEEMECYGMNNGRNNYLQDHYLCLWEVTPFEVIGTFEWNDVRENQNWYRDWVEPAFLAARKKFEERRFR